MFSSKKLDREIPDLTPPTQDKRLPEPSFARSERSVSMVKSSGKLVPSVIGEDLTVTGNVFSKGEVQVDGEIQGDLNCASLIIGDKGHTVGGIMADDVVVRGRVMGAIRAMRVTLQSTCHVEGDIFHQSLAIEQGAYFEGRSRRSDDPMAQAKKPKSDEGARREDGPRRDDRRDDLSPVSSGSNKPLGPPPQSRRAAE